MKYSIFKADLIKDRDQITSLWSRNLSGHGVPAGRYDWIYHDNPYGQPTTFLLKHDDTDSVVGSYSLFPRPLFLKGRKVNAYICGDLIVDTAHRALGPALSLVKTALAFCREDEGSVLFGFPNNLSEPVLLMGGFKMLTTFTQMTLVVSTYPYILRKLSVPPLAKLLSFPADILLGFRYAAGGAEYDYEILEEFDRRFEQFWDGIMDTFSIKGEMDSGYLNWRFKASPYADYSIFTLLSKIDRQVSGYIVFRQDKKRVSIVDIGCKKGQRAVKDLTSQFYRYLKSQGIWSASFSFSSSEDFIEHLSSVGFSVRSNDWKAIIYAPSESKEIVPEINQGHWYLTSADNDI